MSSAAADGVLQDMLVRLDALQRQVTAKDGELSKATTRALLLERELVRSQQETAAARAELQKEALRSSLLEQVHTPCTALMAPL